LLGSVLRTGDSIMEKRQAKPLLTRNSQSRVVRACVGGLGKEHCELWVQKMPLFSLSQCSSKMIMLSTY
jgi:hypothetical protein